MRRRSNRWRVRRGCGATPCSTRSWRSRSAKPAAKRTRCRVSSAPSSASRLMPSPSTSSAFCFFRCNATMKPSRRSGAAWRSRRWRRTSGCCSAAFCQSQRDRQGAHAAYARALSISPNLASAHYGMGTSLMSQAAYAAAAEHFRIASVNAPGDLQARLKLAGCLLEIGQTDTALAALRTCLRGGEKHVYAMSLKLMLNSGRGRFWLRPSAALRALT